MPIRAPEQAQPPGAPSDLAYVPPPGAPGAPPVREARPAVDESLLRDLLRAEVAAPSSGPAAPRREAPRRLGPPRVRPQPVAEGPPIARAAPPLAPPAASDMEWWKQQLAEAGGFILFGAIPYALDLAFTVFGLTRTILPASVAGMLVATLLHVFMSIGQRHFLVQPGGVWWIGAGLLIINGGLNLYGMIPVIDVWLGPWVLGALPRDPGAWPGALLAALWGGLAGGSAGQAGAWPAWTPAALILIVTAGLIGWLSEPLLGFWWGRVGHTWRRRPY